MTNAPKPEGHPAHFGDYIRIARKRRCISAEDAAVRLGFSAPALRCLESGEGPRASRAKLFAIAALYGVPHAEVLAMAGGAPCCVPETQDFLGTGARAYCACGWPLDEHAAGDLANALRACTALKWYPSSHDRVPMLSEYRRGLVDTAHDAEDAREEVARRERGHGALPRIPGQRRSLVDLLEVIP